MCHWSLEQEVAASKVDPTMHVPWIRSLDACACVPGKSLQNTPKLHPRIWGSSWVGNETANDLHILLLAGIILLALLFILKQFVQHQIHLHLQPQEHVIQRQHCNFTEKQKCHPKKMVKRHHKIPTISSTSWAHLQTWRGRKGKAAGVESSTWRAKGWQLEESFRNVAREAGKIQDHSETRTSTQLRTFPNGKVKQIWQHQTSSRATIPRKASRQTPNPSTPQPLNPY